MPIVDQDMAKRLKQARELNHFRTAKEATDTLKLTYSTYKNHEDGWRGFARHATQYAGKFRVNLTWLLTGHGAPRSNEQRHPAAELYDGLTPEKQAQALEFLVFLNSQKGRRG